MWGFGSFLKSAINHHSPYYLLINHKAIRIHAMLTAPQLNFWLTVLMLRHLTFFFLRIHVHAYINYMPQTNFILLPHFETCSVRSIGRIVLPFFGMNLANTRTPFNSSSAVLPTNPSDSLDNPVSNSGFRYYPPRTMPLLCNMVPPCTFLRSRVHVASIAYLIDIAFSPHKSPYCL